MKNIRNNIDALGICIVIQTRKIMSTLISRALKFDDDDDLGFIEDTVVVFEDEGCVISVILISINSQLQAVVDDATANQDPLDISLYMRGTNSILITQLHHIAHTIRPAGKEYTMTRNPGVTRAVTIFFFIGYKFFLIRIFMCWFFTKNKLHPQFHDPASSESILSNVDEKLESALDEAGSAKIKLSLIGKIYGIRLVNREGFITTINRVWNTVNGFEVEQIATANAFVFYFRTAADMDTVLKGGPCSFDNQILVLLKLDPIGDLESLDYNKTPIWVQIYKVSLACMTEKVALPTN
ncbi:hypothetical protein Scep_030131 [Stephania cephalantha]|uniref:DUF4283 domain-containing protein n=1 Tax=Stephania cephalantha TaxID=152367 RepID=A0AAP0E1W3_9MAGN